MRVHALGMIVLAALVGAAASAQGKVTDETVLARVGTGGEITKKALVEHLLRYDARIAIQTLIDRSVVKQEAERRKITVSDADLELAVAEARKAATEGLDKALEKEGINEAAFRDRLRYSLLGTRIRDAMWPVVDDDLVRLRVRFCQVQTERQAKEVIREAKNGASFELLVLQRSTTRDELGLVQPDPFLRAQVPQWFQVVRDAGLRQGQITSEPIERKGYWFVVKLEQELGPETLKGKDRENAVNFIKAYRTTFLLPTLRKHFTITQPASVQTLLADMPGSPTTVVAKVGNEEITRKQLMVYLFESFGRAGLQQLVERSILTQEAARLRVSVSDSELEARKTALVKSLGEPGFQSFLTGEGIAEDAWRDRVRYEALAEKVIDTKYPPKPEELERLSARYVRVATKREADEILRLAQNAPFEQVIAARSLDRDKPGNGFVQPNPFLKVDNAKIYEAIQNSRVMPGQVLPEPVAVGSSLMVVRFEGRRGPETLTPAERAAAVRRLHIPQMIALLDQNRQDYPVQFPVKMETVVADARG